MRLHLEHLSLATLLTGIFIMATVSLSVFMGRLSTPELRDLATALALGMGMTSLATASYNLYAVMPQFVQVFLFADGDETDKKYRVVAEVMNIGGGFAGKCTCEVMRIVDGRRMELPERIQLKFVPVDTSAGKLDPLLGSQTFAMPPKTRVYLRDYIPEGLRDEGKRNMVLKLDADGRVVWSHEFGLPDWAVMVNVQKQAQWQMGFP